MKFTIRRYPFLFPVNIDRDHEQYVYKLPKLRQWSDKLANLLVKIEFPRSA